MLVFSRGTNEHVVIGEGPDAVRVYVVEIRHPNLVRLGFDAPKSVRIDRAEIRDKKEAQGDG